MINPFSMLQGMVNGQSPAAQFMQSMQGSNIENAMKQAQQMMQGNPSLWGRVQQMMQGKNPAQLKRVAENIAKERGIDLNQFQSNLMQQLGLSQQQAGSAKNLFT